MIDNEQRRQVALHTLGCKLNYAESSTIASSFARREFEIVDFGGRADVVVVNSCTVTENADRECRQIVRRALRANPAAYVIVTGCYAQLQPEEIASIEGVDLVLGSAEKFRIFDIEQEFIKGDVPRIAVDDISGADEFGPAFSGESDSRTRAFLKVQDGCDYNCSFCTIPLARGASRSHLIDDAYRNACDLVEAGYREIVLTGVNVGDFGKGRSESLFELLVRLHDVPRLERLKISSIEPNLLEDRIIDLAAESDRLLPHFHLPLQSGSDEILGSMRRRYRSAQYRDRVERVLERMPGAAVGVDVIVGFPGESRAHFEATHQFLHELPAAYFHVFTYSERDNTPAAGIGDVVVVSERRQRTRVLRSLSEKKRAAFALRHSGATLRALFEHGNRDGKVVGLTDNYIRVAAQYDPALENVIADILVGDFNGDFADAEVKARHAADGRSEFLALPVLR